MNLLLPLLSLSLYLIHADATPEVTIGSATVIGQTFQDTQQEFFGGERTPPNSDRADLRSIAHS